MDNKEKGIFLPKGTDGRYKDIMILHIQGLILVLVLMIMLFSSVGIMGRTITKIFLDSVGNSVSPEDIMLTMDLAGLGDLATKGFAIFQKVYSVFGALIYVLAILSIIVTIYLLGRMKGKISEIIDDSAPYENPVRVKKITYVLLGFLLGAFGAHLFLIKKKKAWIYLLMGILGTQITPLILYTTGISFADAFMACFIEKDEEGYIEIEDYPYWI